MGSGDKFLRALFRAFILVGFIWFVAVGILGNQGAKTTSTTSSSQDKSSPQGLKHGKAVGSADELQVDLLHPNSSDLIYMSKRKVPNGPDPIHNRRSGNSGRPPGQA